MPWRVDPVSDADWDAALDGSGAQSLLAEAYWSRLRPVLPQFGISRIADITGLDRVGLPVVQAVRPAARSNAVTQGKAMSLTAAAIGATLECLEMAAGEVPGRLPLTTGDAALWHDLAPGARWPTSDTPYIAARDLTAGRPAAVPRDLISTDFARGAEAEAAPILRHSIGLGAGTTLGAALRHGLFEAIEADARIRAEAGGTETRILPETDASYASLSALIQQAGLRCALTQMPCAAGLTAIKASVMEPPGASALPLPATGFAARVDPAGAVAAAMAEALQARLAVISGAREDITQRYYDLDVPAQALDEAWDWHGPQPGVPLAPTPAATPTTRALAQAVGPVFAVVLHWDAALPLAITRIVAPTLIADPLRLEETG